MVFIKAHRKQLLLAGSLAAAVTAFTVTACGGGSVAAVAQGSAPGQWTQAEVSQFTAAGGSGGSASQDSCIVGYFERDMSFGNAMAVVSVDSASGTSLSAAQVKAALVSKYGTAEGDAINAQFGQVVTNADNNCGGSAAPSTAPTADPAATSESSCTVDCVNPIASGESGWLAQVQGALQNVQQDLAQISSDESSDPEALSLDGANLAGDAQAVLNDETDPAPVDNSDFVAAMNDYIAAGNDYSGDNSSGQQNVTQADQEVAAGTAALKSFEAANTGSSAAAPATTAPASSAAAATTPAAAATASCGTQMKLWYIQDGGKNQIAVFHGTWNGPGGITTDTTLANLHAAGQALLGATLGPVSGSPPACDAVAARAWKTAMRDLGEAGTIEQHVTTITVTPAAAQDANAGFAALATVTAEGNKYAAQP
jgi:hypothetical protein